MRTVTISFVVVICLVWSGPTWSAENKETTPMQKDGMVMTVLEAQVSKPNWPKLAEVYSQRAQKLPPGLVQTFLVHSRDENTVWRIISVWESQHALDEMRRTTETPGGFLIFRAAGAEPKLGVYDVNQHVRR
jgi:heme-degrading monooxygenase HmoA